MNRSRRHALRAIAAVGAAIAGCLGEPPTEGGAQATTTGAGSRVRRGEASPVTVETTVDRDGIEYLEDGDAVRYVAAYRAPENFTATDGPPTRTPVYETVAFEEWAEVECASAGSTRVVEAVRSRVDGGSAISGGVTSRDNTTVILVIHQTLLDVEGNVLSEPDVGFDRLVAAAPRSVAVELRLEEREHACTVPVYVRHVTIRQE